jgi:hypothetical protein
MRINPELIWFKGVKPGNRQSFNSQLRWKNVRRFVKIFEIKGIVAEISLGNGKLLFHFSVDNLDRNKFSRHIHNSIATSNPKWFSQIKSRNWQSAINMVRPGRNADVIDPPQTIRTVIWVDLTNSKFSQHCSGNSPVKNKTISFWITQKGNENKSINNIRLVSLFVNLGRYFSTVDNISELISSHHKLRNCWPTEMIAFHWVDQSTPGHSFRDWCWMKTTSRHNEKKGKQELVVDHEHSSCYHPWNKSILERTLMSSHISSIAWLHMHCRSWLWMQHYVIP